MTINIDDEIKKLIGKCLIVFEIKKHVICNNDNEHNVYNIKRKDDCIIIYYRYIDQGTKCYVSDYISLDKNGIDFLKVFIPLCRKKYEDFLSNFNTKELNNLENLSLKIFSNLDFF